MTSPHLYIVQKSFHFFTPSLVLFICPSCGQVYLHGYNIYRYWGLECLLWWRLNLLFIFSYKVLNFVVETMSYILLVNPLSFIQEICAKNSAPRFPLTIVFGLSVRLVSRSFFARNLLRWIFLEISLPCFSISLILVLTLGWL